MDPYLSKNSHHAQSKGQGVSVGHVIAYDYTGLAEIYRMLKQLDDVYESVSEQSAMLQQLDDFKDPELLQLQRELMNLVNLTTSEKHHQGMTDSIDELKSEIVSLSQEISGLQDNKTNRFYAVAFRLHNVSAKLSEQLKREKLRLQELQSIGQKSTLQLKSLEYDINVLKEKQAGLQRQLEVSTVKQYSSVSDQVIFAKYMQLEKKRRFLKDTYDEQKSAFLKQYNAKMMSMIPLLEQANETDSKLIELKKRLLHQQLVIEELTINQSQSDEVIKIGQMLNKLEVKKNRAKTQLPGNGKSDGQVVRSEKKKHEYKTDMENDSRVSSLRTKLKTLPQEREIKPSKAMMRIFSKPQEIQAIKLLKIQKDSIVTIAGRIESTDSTPKHRIRQQLERHITNDSSYMSRLKIRRESILSRVSQPDLQHFAFQKLAEISESRKQQKRKLTAVKHPIRRPGE